MAYNPDFTSSVVTTAVRFELIRFWYTGDTSPAPVGFVWDFGDGITSNEEEPIVSWRTVGNKTVKLTVIYDDDVQDSEEKIGYLSIVEGSLTSYLNLLLTQYRDKSSIRALISPFIDQVTQLDFVADQLSRIWSLEGRGVQLDVIGEILGLPRLGLSDAAYAVALTSMPEILHGCGNYCAICKYTYLFLDFSYIQLIELVGTVYLDVIMSGTRDYPTFLRRVQAIAASGVAVRLAVSDDGDIPVECEYTNEPPVYPSGNELSEISYEDNGYLAELF